MAIERIEDDRLTLIGLLLESGRGLVARMEEIHRSHGLQGPEFSALLRLRRSPGRCLRMSALAAQIGLSTSGATTLVERLLKRGLVTRETDPDDRRALVVTLTGSGEEAVGSVVADLLPMVDTHVLPAIGSDLEVLMAALTRLRDSLSPDAAAL